MYDYLIVGSGLYGAVFAHEAKKTCKNILVVDNCQNIADNVYTEAVEEIHIHKYGATSSIPTTLRSGTTSRNSQHSIVSQILFAMFLLKNMSKRLKIQKIWKKNCVEDIFSINLLIKDLP